MVTISTKVLPETETKPKRIKAIDCEGRFSIIIQQTADDVDDDHKNAALQLMQKMGWYGVMQGGHTYSAKDGYGMVFCFIEQANQIINNKTN